MDRILITGGCGFIGSNLVKAYIDRHRPVVVLDNLSAGNMENLGKYKPSAVITQSIEDIDLIALMKEHDISVVHHLAARPRVKYSVDFPVETNEQNISNTVRILDAARKTGVRRVVYSASSSAYGNTDVFPTHEDVPTNPRSPYALQKYVGEDYCRMFCDLYGLDTVSLRYFNVFGPNSFADSEYSAVIPIFIEQVYKGEKLTVDGSGEQSRDFTYVDNVVLGNILAAMHPVSLHGQVINLACGDNISINALAELIEELVGKRVERLHRVPRPGDVLKTQADITRARRILNFEPIVKFDEGLKRTVEWYLEYLENR